MRCCFAPCTARTAHIAHHHSKPRSLPPLSLGEGPSRAPAWTRRRPVFPHPTRPFTPPPKHSPSPPKPPGRGPAGVLDGIEKAERNVLPVLNNLLENREMALDDGRFLMPPAHGRREAMGPLRWAHNGAETRTHSHGPYLPPEDSPCNPPTGAGRGTERWVPDFATKPGGGVGTQSTWSMGYCAERSHPSQIQIFFRI